MEEITREAQKFRLERIPLDTVTIGAELEGIAANLTMISNSFLEHETRFDDNIIGSALYSLALQIQRVATDVIDS